MEKVNLAQKLSTFQEHWVPRIVGELNDQYVKVVKFKGPYVWHDHESEDELFYVYRGRIVIHMKGRPDVALGTGQLAVVPKGVEHRPRSPDPSYVLMFEPYALQSRGDLSEKNDH